MAKLESEVGADFAGYAPYAGECFKDSRFSCPLRATRFYKCKTLAEAREAAIREGLIVFDQFEMLTSEGHKIIDETRQEFTAYCFKQSNDPANPCGSSRVTLYK